MGSSIPFDQVKWPSLLHRSMGSIVAGQISTNAWPFPVLGRAGGGIMMMMWLLNFQENSADMVWWLSSLLSHALPDKNSSLDDSEKNAPDQGEHTWTTWKKNSNGSRCQSKALLMRLISIAPDFNMLCWMHSTPPALSHVPIARVHE